MRSMSKNLILGGLLSTSRTLSIAHTMLSSTLFSGDLKTKMFTTLFLRHETQISVGTRVYANY